MLNYYCMLYEPERVIMPACVNGLIRGSLR
jgi:hypothetical protein